MSGSSPQLIGWRPAALLSATLAILAWCHGSPARAGAEDLPASATNPPDVSTDFDLPAGFRITLYAGDDLAHDIYSMTLDAKGRVVVAGPGYVKTLFDDDGDGQADRAELFSSLPASGAQGLCFDGHDLLFTGDGMLGRLRDADGNGHADAPPEAWARLRGGEHGAHAILLGPDGWFDVVCGNDAGVSALHVTAEHSPVRQPRSGAILRVSRDGRQTQVLAHGFRNPYDIAFSPSGQMFTVDSDGERDHHLPWYAPTRLFDVAIGREHGWLSGGHVASWSRPASWADNVPRAAELGRGSPTGIVCCRHRAFPERYHGGLFGAEWTFGRVYFLPLTPAGSTFTSQPEVFMQSRGSSGLAPVDLEIGPRGDLFVATGGRRTQGSVYRVYYAGNDEQPGARDAAGGDAHAQLLSVLRADQPLSAWSRAQWVPAAQELGQPAIEAAILDESLPVADRVRAIEVVTELWQAPSVPAARIAAKTRDPEVRARLAWTLTTIHDYRVHAELVTTLVNDGDPLVLRSAIEAGMRRDLIVGSTLQSLTSTDRYARAAIIAQQRGVQMDIRSTNERALARSLDPTDPYYVRKRLAHLGMRVGDSMLDLSGSSTGVSYVASVASDCKIVDLRLEALRLIMLALGDVDIESPPDRGMVGYVARKPENLPAADREMLAKRLTPLLPSDDAELDRELVRVLAMLAADVPGVLERVTAKLTNASVPQDDLHYLFALSRIGGPRTPEVTNATAAALVGLHGKLAARGEFVSRTWPLRVTEAFGELCRRDPSLARAVGAAPAFGLPEHAMFVLAMPETDRPAAARRLLAAVATKRAGEESDNTEIDADEPNTWTAELVQALACLPNDELFPALRARADDPNVRDAIASVLARNPQAVDRERFVAALDSFELGVVRQAAAALGSLPKLEPAEIAAALRALDRTIRDDQQLALAPGSRSKPGDRETPRAGRDARARLVALVELAAGRTFAIDEQGIDAAELDQLYEPLFDWFRAEHPAESAALEQSTAIDLAAWRARLAAINWSAGNVEAGRAIFERQNCHRCHRGNERRGNDRLGPDLAGAAARFSRDDLFAAIVDPSRDVAPLYRTTIISTRDGRVFTGLIVYESPDGTLLQTGPDTTVRITGDELASQRASEQSLMPTGLLAGLSDQQLADLDAYLRSLAGEAPATAR
ncbi:MAG: c-type cytochrome [Pirellulales bacterium]|nr:c-type cytochrome [Pirellulales bacterium]